MSAGRLIAVGALLGAFVIHARAQAPGKQEEKESPAKAAPAKPARRTVARKPNRFKSYRGTVVSVDPAAKKLVLKDDAGTPEEFVIGDKTKLTKGGARKPITLEDIKAGDAALVFHEGDVVEKVHVAVAVRAKPAGDEKKPAPPKNP